MTDAGIIATVSYSLKEDIGSGDITAELIPDGVIAHAEVVSRESAVICGIEWFNEVYRQIDNKVNIEWLVEEGNSVTPNQCFVTLQGPASSLVTGERCALNWLQTLSGTATLVSQYVKCLDGQKTQLLDTRKTLPGLRHAQKHAVQIGGGKNHRMGLFDAYLIKENHITSCGSIEKAIRQARKLYSDKLVEVEVENLEELQQALSENADIVLLDNFTLETMREAVAINKNRATLEVSGNVEPDQLKKIAATGVDYISMGALTKHLRAIDLSMRLRHVPSPLAGED